MFPHAPTRRHVTSAADAPAARGGYKWHRHPRDGRGRRAIRRLIVTAAVFCGGDVRSPPVTRTTGGGGCADGRARPRRRQRRSRRRRRRWRPRRQRLRRGGSARTPVPEAARPHGPLVSHGRDVDVGLLFGCLERGAAVLWAQKVAVMWPGPGGSVKGRRWSLCCGRIPGKLSVALLLN